MSEKLDKFEEKINKIAKSFDRIAGWMVFAAMIVVVINVILRKLVGIDALTPFFERTGITGMLKMFYDYVGFLTAMIVALGLAYCLVNDAHISIDFIADKLDKKSHGVISIITSSLAFLIMAVFTYSLFAYATTLLQKHSVSANAQVPICIFVYIIAICFVLLDLVMLTKVRKHIKDVKKL